MNCRLSKASAPFLTEDAPAMHRICKAIAAKRQREANILPAPEGWRLPKPSPIKRLRAVFLHKMTGIRTPELGEAYHETNHLDPL